MKTPEDRLPGHPAGGLPHDDAEQRAWLEAHLQRLGVTATELARRAGLNPSTLTRFLGNVVDGHTLTFRTMRKLEQAASRMAGQPARAGSEAALFDDSGADMVSASVRALAGDRNTMSKWRVTTDWLAPIGIYRDDILVCDESAQPTAGDVVCASLGDPAADMRQVVFRLFDPPFLLSGSTIAGKRRPVIVDGENARIVGVVVGRISPRFTTKAA